MTYGRDALVSAPVALPAAPRALRRLEETTWTFRLSTGSSPPGRATETGPRSELRYAARPSYRASAAAPPGSGGLDGGGFPQDEDSGTTRLASASRKLAAPLGPSRTRSASASNSEGASAPDTAILTVRSPCWPGADRVPGTRAGRRCRRRDTPRSRVPRTAR